MEEVVGTPIRRLALIVRQVVRRGLEREPRLSPPQTYVFIQMRRKTPPFRAEISPALGQVWGFPPTVGPPLLWGRSGDFLRLSVIRRCRQANLLLKYACSLFDNWIRSCGCLPQFVGNVKCIASS